MTKRWGGIWNPQTIADQLAKDLLKKPDSSYAHHIKVIDGVEWVIPCGQIWCEDCEQCMACADQDCLAGEDHVWPEGWQELCRKLGVI